MVRATARAKFAAASPGSAVFGYGKETCALAAGLRNGNENCTPRASGEAFRHSKRRTHLARNACVYLRSGKANTYNAFP